MTNDQVIIGKIIEQKHKEIAPEMEASKFFELFSTSEILKEYDLSFEELESGNVGRGNDGGIDSAYLFFNGELVSEDTEIEASKKTNIFEIHLVQSKRTNGFSEEALNKFQVTTGEIFNFSADFTSFRTVYCPEILDFASRFKAAYNSVLLSCPKVEFHYYYATLGAEVHPNVRRKVDQIKSTIRSLFSEADFNFTFLCAGDLLKKFRESPKTSHELEFAENPIATEENSYVCLATLRKYYEFITEDNGLLNRRIFEANVRDYQGNVKVNTAIQATLQNNDSPNFWYLNNGITIVCGRASTSGKKLLIEDPQIVNGLQTSYEIFAYFDRISPKPNDERKVLIRLIVPESEEIKDEIIRCTNSQTAMPSASLRAADRIQRNIEDFLFAHGYFYERRKNFYKNQGKPINKIVSIPYLAQCVISVLLQKPDFARARPSTLLNRDEDYESIFSVDYPVSLYLKCLIMMDHVLAGIRQLRGELDVERRDANNIKYHCLMLAVMDLAGDADLLKAKEIAELAPEQCDPNMIGNRIRLVWERFVEEGQRDQVVKSRSFSRALIEKVKGELDSNSMIDI